MKPLWLDDLSPRSLAEIMTSESENRAWNKLLRSQVTALVDSRLAKHISLEKYTEARQRGHEDAAECKRRSEVLFAAITSRQSHL